MGAYSVNVVPAFDASNWACGTDHNETITSTGFRCAALGWARSTVNLRTFFKLNADDNAYSLPDQIKVICSTDFDIFLTVSYQNVDDKDIALDNENQFYSVVLFIPAGQVYSRIIKIEPSNVDNIVFNVQRVSEGTNGQLSRLELYLKKDGTTDITQVSGTTGDTWNSMVNTPVTQEISSTTTNPLQTAIQDLSLNTAIQDIGLENSQIIQALNDAGYSPGGGISMRIEGSTLYITF